MPIISAAVLASMGSHVTAIEAELGERVEIDGRVVTSPSSRPSSANVRGDDDPIESDFGAATGSAVTSSGPTTIASSSPPSAGGR